MTPAQFARIARCSEEAARERTERHDSKVRGDGKMITLDEYNERRHGPYPNIGEWVGSEIACPKCGAELTEEHGIALLSDPPQQRVGCQCGFEGCKIL